MAVAPLRLPYWSLRGVLHGFRGYFVLYLLQSRRHTSALFWLRVQREIAEPWVEMMSSRNQDEAALALGRKISESCDQIFMQYISEHAPLTTSLNRLIGLDPDAVRKCTAAWKTVQSVPEQGLTRKQEQGDPTLAKPETAVSLHSNSRNFFISFIDNNEPPIKL